MGKLNEVTLKIDGMRCAACVSSIEKGLSQLGGVADCSVNLATKSATVSYDGSATSEESIIDRLKQLGYSAVAGQPDILTTNRREVLSAGQQLRISLALTIPLVALAMWPTWAGQQLIPIPFNGWAQALLAAVVLFYCGRSIIADALRQARHARTNMNSLISMGSLTAFGWSSYLLVDSYRLSVSQPLYFESVGMIITLILLGRYLEARARGRAGDAIQALVDLRPAKATAIIRSVEIEIDAATVQPGMTLLVKPGERLAADGEIIEGHPVIDQSMLTGESMPVEKGPSDQVIGGSVNGNRSFKFKVTAAGEESYLAGMVRLVAQAQSRKAPVQKLADRVAGVFVPVVIGVALLTLAAWYWFAPDSPMLIRSVISVLIIACPCALGLATPTAILAGTGRAAREGIIIRGGDILENITHLNAVIFDKTGTLTHGELEVVEVVAMDNSSSRELIRMAGSAEKQTAHPLGKAIVRYMETEQIEAAPVTNVQVRPGFGMEAIYRGGRLLIGNKALLKTERIDLSDKTDLAADEMSQGRTVVFVALDGNLIGLISLGDRLRGDAAKVVAELRKSMGRVAMLSGDNYRTVAGVARSIGLEYYEAEVKPDQKQEVIESYQKAGFRLAMVGDGINDAPALAAADVGIAIGGGTDVAIEAADVVMVRSDLGDIIKMFELARQSMRVIKQNLFWAFFYNVLAIPLAAGLFYPLFGWTLSPMVAAAAMAFSSVFVVTNSLRLNRLPLD
jgi:Cu+-exporting ATPase